MSKRIFSKEQINELLKNRSIEKCSEKSITFTKAFKMRAVVLYEQGVTSPEIFRQAGLNLTMVGRNQPKDCLRRWNKIVKKKGTKGLSEVRGKKSSGRPKIKNLTTADKIQRLEAEVAYLKAENDFLAKLRAARAE